LVLFFSNKLVYATPNRVSDPFSVKLGVAALSGPRPFFLSNSSLELPPLWLVI
jgi:hypothetical protein